MKERDEKTEVDIVIVTLKVTCHCVCEGKLRKIEAKSKENEKNSREKCDGGSKKTTKKFESESKGTNNSSTKANKITSETKSEIDINFIVIQKTVRSVNSSERFDELTQEVKGCRWDAGLTNETWIARNAEIRATQLGHIFMGSGRLREQTRSLNSGEQEVANTHQLDRLHQRTRHINVGHCQQTTCSVDECSLHPLGICGPPR